MSAPDRSEEGFEYELRPEKPRVVASIFGASDVHERREKRWANAA
jgi:hypothetical protein